MKQRNLRTSGATTVFAAIALAASIEASAAQAPPPPRVEVRQNLLPNRGIVSAAFSPDGKYLLLGDPVGGVQLWNAATARLIRSYKADTTQDRRYVSSTAVSTRARLIAGLDRDGAISVWDVESGRFLRTVPGADGHANIAFAADGKQLLVLGDGKLRTFDTTSWQLISTAAIGELQYALFNPFKLSPDEKTAATVLKDEATVRVFDIATGRTIRDFGGHISVNDLAFSTDGRFLVTGSGADPEAGKPATPDNTVRIWEVASGRLVRALNGHTAPVRTVAFSSDGLRVTSISGDCVIKRWDARSGAEIGTSRVNSGGRTGWQLVNGATIAVVRNEDESVDVLDPENGAARKLGNKLESITATTIARDQLLVASMRPDAVPPHSVRDWNLTTGQFVANWKISKAPPTAAVFSPDGVLAASGSEVAEGQTAAVTIWDTEKGSAVRTLAGYSKKTAGLAFSSDGSRLAVADANASVTLWDVTTGAQIWHITLPAAETKYDDAALAFSPQTRQLVYGSGTRIAVLDVTTGRLQRQIEHRVDYSISSIAVSPDGRRAIVSDRAWDTNVKIWDLQTGRLVRVLKGHEDAAWAVAYSPNGKLVISGSADGTARIWDAATGAVKHILSTDSGNLVRTIVFTPNGARALLGYADGAIRIWDTANGTLIATLLAALDGAGWIALTPEGFFDLDPGLRGADLIHVVRGLEVVGIDQLFQSLYRPALVRERLAGDPRGLLKAATARTDLGKVLASGSPPDVSVLKPKPENKISDSIAAEVAVTAASGGIGRVEWRVNGVTIAVDRPTDGNQPVASGRTSTLRRDLPLDVGQNLVEVVAYNHANLVASTPKSITVTASGTTATKPRLFVLLAGINKYVSRGLDLSNPLNDTAALEQTLRRVGKDRYEDVDITRLSDAQVNREQLAAMFDKLSQRMRPTDVFVFFLAGHGLTESGRYYFIPNDFAASAPLKEAGISQDEFQNWFARIPAKRSILLFDTCQGGSLATDPEELRDLEETAAQGRLAQATGRTIFTASAENEDALESFEGHGLFTYSLIRALMWADYNADGAIEVTELAAYAYAHVASLSEMSLRRRQRPRILIRGPNFPLTNSLPLGERAPSKLVIPAKPTHRVSAATDLQVVPALGAATVGTLAAGTEVVLFKSEAGWALIAKDGRPLGYVLSNQLEPIPR